MWLHEATHLQRGFKGLLAQHHTLSSSGPLVVPLTSTCLRVVTTCLTMNITWMEECFYNGGKSKNRAMVEPQTSISTGMVNAKGLGRSINMGPSYSHKTRYVFMLWGAYRRNQVKLQVFCFLCAYPHHSISISIPVSIVKHFVLHNTKYGDFFNRSLTHSHSKVEGSRTNGRIRNILFDLGVFGHFTKQLDTSITCSRKLDEKAENFTIW